MERYSKVYDRKKQEYNQVRIGSRLKPAIYDEVIEKWQSLLDLIIKIIGVPSGLIMKLNEDTIEVFLAGNSEDNPYKKGEKEKLAYGLYCETVIGSQDKLHVPDATKSPVWRENNPDVNINMVSYLGYPVNWPDGEVFGTICILDKKENFYSVITEELLLKVKSFIETDLNSLLLKQQLAEKNEELQKAITVKDRFFSIISHDLRSPFNSILGFSQLIVDQLKEKNYEGLDEYAENMLQSSQRAMNLVVNLLEWSRTQSDRMEFNPEYFELVDFLNETILTFKGIATQKSITINHSFPDFIPVYADKQMINTVLRNLISNAVKFTRQGGEVTISAARKQSAVSISVKDNGVGISKNRIEKLFRIDESESTKGTANEQGTGLGLILCKEFVEKHGGRIWVESAVDTGSAFTFTIPENDSTTMH